MRSLKRLRCPKARAIYNANEEIGPLTKGMTAINANGERVTFSGEPIRMNQMTVDFTLKPLVWSDGTPVTAQDSVFSFHVIGDPNTQRLDKRFRRPSRTKRQAAHPCAGSAFRATWSRNT